MTIALVGSLHNMENVLLQALNLAKVIGIVIIKNPYHLSKDDRYSNLIVLHESVHRLIHLKDESKIKTILNALKLTNKQIEKVNQLRKQCKNYTI